MDWAAEDVRLEMEDMMELTFEGRLADGSAEVMKFEMEDNTLLGEA